MSLKPSTKKDVRIWGTIIAISDGISGALFIYRGESFVGGFGVVSSLIIGYLLYKSGHRSS